MRAPRVKRQAFCRRFTSPEFRTDQFKRGCRVQVLVRDNNVDQALKALKKKMQREGIFREMKLRGHYDKPSEKKAREKAEAGAWRGAWCRAWRRRWPRRSGHWFTRVALSGRLTKRDCCERGPQGPRY